MLPLVAATGVTVASAAPTAFYLRERYDLVVAARSQATRVGDIVRDEIEERPSLWRYDEVKIAERLVEVGLGGTHIAIADAAGAPVYLASVKLPALPLWGRVDVVTDGVRVATVWAAADQAPLVADTWRLWFGFALLGLVLAAVLYLLPVRAIAAAERRITLLLGRLALTLQEEDRRRIARDLHDGAGQAITAARLELLALRSRGLDPTTAQRIAEHLDEALSEVRRSTTALAPPALAELGLARAIIRHCEAFGDAAGFEVECRVADELPSLGGAVETACYRIVQEALTNTARHGGATRAWVRLDTEGGALRMEVGDDGVGLAEGAGASGQGIEGIRERVRLLGGEVTVDSGRNRGVRISVIVPLIAAAEGLG